MSIEAQYVECCIRYSKYNSGRRYVILHPAVNTILTVSISARVFCNTGHIGLVSYRRPNAKIYCAAFPKYVATKAVKMMRSISVQFWVRFVSPFTTLSIQI
jgi:hypothetical protein